MKSYTRYEARCSGCTRPVRALSESDLRIAFARHIRNCNGVKQDVARAFYSAPAEKSSAPTEQGNGE